MSKEAQRHYQLLKDKDELTEIFPKATGDWDIDRVPFTKLYIENIKFVLDFEKGEIDLEEDDFIL